MKFNAEKLRLWDYQTEKEPPHASFKEPYHPVDCLAVMDGDTLLAWVPEEFAAHFVDCLKAAQGLDIIGAGRRMTPGRYISPAGVHGRLSGFDELARHYVFTPDGAAAPAVIDSVWGDPRSFLGEAQARKYIEEGADNAKP